MKNHKTLILFFILLISLPVFAQTKGTIRNTGSGNFEDPALWQIFSGTTWGPLYHAPAATDSLIKLSTGTTVTINSTISLDEVYIPGTTTLTLASGVNLNIIPGPQGYDFDVYGTINGSGTISLQSGVYFALEGGTLSGTNVMNINFGATLEPVTNPSNISITVNNYGTITQNVQSFNGTGTINNYANYIVNNTFSVNANPNVNNYSTFTKNGTGNFSFAGAINNQSTISINAGRIIYDPTTNSGVNTWNGSTVIGSGATFQVGGYWNYKMNITGSLSGAGDVAFYGGTDTIKANYNISGNTIVAGGSIYFPATTTFTNIGKFSQSAGIVYWLPGVVFGAYHPDFNFTGGTIYMNSGKSYTFNNFVLAGVLDGNDTITINTSLNWTKSGFNNTGVVTLAATCTTTCVSNAVYNYRTLKNYGMFTWTGTYFNGTGSFNNYGTTDLKSDFGYSCNNLVNNYGTFNKLTNNVNNFTLGLNNSGIINIPTGGLSIQAPNGTFSIGGTINVSSGATLNIGVSGANATYNCTGTIAGSGAVTFGSSIVNVSGIYNITGSTGISSGNTYFLTGVNIISFGSFSFTGGTMTLNTGVSTSALPNTLTIAAGTLKFTTGNTVSIQNLVLNGTIDGTDTVKILNTCLIDKGSFSGTGVTRLYSTCSTQVVNSLCFFSRTVINEGTMTITNVSVGGNGPVLNKGNIYYNSTGNYVSWVLVNDGLFVKSGPGALTMYGETNNDTILVTGGNYYHYYGTFVNNSKVIVESGATFQTGTSFTNNATFEIASGGNVTGNYTITNNNAVFVNNGSIAPANTFAGTSTISGTGAFTNSAFTVNTGAVLNFASGHQLKNLTVNSGGRCFMNTGTVQFNGTGTIISNSGTFSTAGCVIEYNGSAAQTVSVTGITYDGLSVNNSAGVTLPSAKSVNTLYLKSGVFTISTFLTLPQNAVIYRGNGSLNGTPVFTTSASVEYTGTQTVTIGTELPVLPVQTGYIKIDDTAGVTINRNITVRDSIVFVNGNLITGNLYSVTLTTGGRLWNESVNGSLQGTFNYSETVNVGGSFLGYAGLSVQYGGGILGTVNLTRYTGATGIVTVGTNTSIRRKYVLSSQFPLTTGRNVMIAWHSGDDNGKSFSSGNKAVIWQQVNGKWKIVSGQTDVSSNRMITAQGVTSLTTFTVSDSAHPLAPTLFTKFLIQGRYQDGICLPDTVTGYLTQAAAPFAILDTCVTVYNYNGVAAFNFTSANNGSLYYFSLKGRNFVQTWTSQPVMFANDNSSWDFSTGPDKAFGNNQLFNGYYSEIYTGDVNQDGVVDLSDLLEIDNDNSNFAGGYLLTDLNSDFVVDLSDLLICDNNNTAFVCSMPPASFSAGKLIKPAANRLRGVKAKEQKH